MMNQNFELVDIDSTFPIESLIEFCSHAENDRPELKANTNLSVRNWENSPNTLLFTIYKEKRFDGARARYRGVALNGKIVAAAGYYQLDNYPEICLMSCRTYTIPEFRSNLIHGKLLVPSFIKDAENLHYKVGMFTFNEYNIWLKRAISRFGKTIDGYSGWKDLGFPITVKNTTQWGLYRLIDVSYEQQFIDTISGIRAD